MRVKMRVKKKNNTWRKIPIDDHKTSKMVKLAKT